MSILRNSYFASLPSTFITLYSDSEHHATTFSTIQYGSGLSAVRSCPSHRLMPIPMCPLKLLLLQFSEELIKAGHIMEVEDGILCMACGKKKKYLSTMRRHLTVHGIGKRYPCPLCEVVISNEAHRRRHINTVHKLTLSFKQIREMPPFTVHTAYSAIGYSAKSDIVPTLTHM